MHHQIHHLTTIRRLPGLTTSTAQLQAINTSTTLSRSRIVAICLWTLAEAFSELTHQNGHLQFSWYSKRDHSSNPWRDLEKAQNASSKTPDRHTYDTATCGTYRFDVYISVHQSGMTWHSFAASMFDIFSLPSAY